MQPTIDLRHLSALGGASDPELCEIIDDFLDELPLNIADCRRMIAAGDLASLREMAHKIRGMSGSMGFKPLCAIATEGDQDTPIENPGGWLDRLETEIAVGVNAWKILKADAQA